MSRYTAVLGFNTKQWWAYDEENDTFIDPPTEILDSLPNWRENVNEAEEVFQKVLNEEPDWLNDEEYIYDGETEI